MWHRPARLAPARFSGSFIPEGQQFALWRHYADTFSWHTLYAHLDHEGPVYRNSTLTVRPVEPRGGSSYGSLVAPLPYTTTGAVLRVRVLHTGSRSFRLSALDSTALGLPPTAILDLDKAGWGTGTIEMQPEIKGAATVFSRTKLDRPSPSGFGRFCPRPCRPRGCTHFLRPRTRCFLSLRTFENRPLGTQSSDLAYYAVRISEALLGHCPIKIAPTVECVEAPAAYTEWLAAATFELDPGRDVANYFMAPSRPRYA